MKVHNYSAGPCILPKEVFQQAAEAVLEYNNSGLSILEMSHRSKDIVEMAENATALVKEILGVPDGYSVLFLQGGASLQFYMSALNLLPVDGKAGYIDTGAWSAKPIKEAKRLGSINVLASSKEANYNYIPKGFDIPEGMDYLHYTTNNTIYGTEFFDTPKTDAILVADMSSDIFSRPINVADYGLIYAGAQKNLGPAGVTLVIVKDEILGKSGRELPSMLDYQIHADKDSMFNTPPVYSIYVCMLTLQWLKKNGGIAWIDKRNQQKADLIYGEIDRNSLFTGTAKTEDRSRMNVTFVLNNEELTEKFNALLTEANISGLKGHGSVGGFRASMYNA
ncbi:MAG: 3-phosphoserine/phosphohydroxythreonine transaminase, partial [Flavobacteriales bacterium]|nr:3-phosphoserine/phosphohydroxythreonine transaminase [Flavobacteriales bacterium]